MNEEAKLAADDGSLGVRVVLIIIANVYAIALMVAHAVYLQPAWGYFGFERTPLSGYSVVFILGLITLVAAVLPVWINRPSAIVLTALFLCVYAPAMTITPALSVDAWQRYGLTLASLTVVFVAAGFASSIRHLHRGNAVPGGLSVSAFLAVWTIIALTLTYKYADILRFVGVSDLYEQRAAGAATSVWIAYAQTYMVHVFSPFLLAMGLVRRNPLLIAIGVSGFVLIYAINAQRTTFLIILVIFALHITQRLPYKIFQTTGFFVGLISILVLVTAIQGRSSTLSTELSSLIVFRAVSIPGLTISQYYDVFLEGGYTFWSHVKFFNIFIPPPALIGSFSQWPGLGYIVGLFSYGDTSHNVNANLFASDGLAAAGPLGVIVIGAVLTLFLHLLDRFSSDWDPRVSVLLTFPFALSLTNAPLFTSILTFGGGFWLLAFMLWRPSQVR